MKEIPLGGERPKGPKPKPFNKDTIALTREEVVEAREEFDAYSSRSVYACFLGDGEGCEGSVTFNVVCRLCKKLAEFAKGEEDE